jgi:mRNA interferase HigB
MVVVPREGLQFRRATDEDAILRLNDRNWNRYGRSLFQIQETAEWRTPEEVKKSHPKASLLTRVAFNIKADDFRLVALVQYMENVLMIRFFGSHEEYNKIDAETV